MPVSHDDVAQRASYWPLPIARAVPTALLALVITFSADHSARFGLVVFGLYGIVLGAVLFVVAGRRLQTSGVRPYLLTQAVVSALSGVVALLLVGGGVSSLFLVLTGWAAVTGALELYCGLRTRGRFTAAVDWLSVGAITAVAAVIFVLLPPEYRQDFTGPDGVPRVLDSSVVAVGMLGAYAAIVAVYLLIAGLSAKWGTRTETTPGSTAVKGENL